MTIPVHKLLSCIETVSKKWKKKTVGMLLYPSMGIFSFPMHPWMSRTDKTAEVCHGVPNLQDSFPGLLRTNKTIGLYVSGISRIYILILYQYMIIYIYICAYLSMYIYICIYTYMYLSIFTYIYVCIYIYICICVRIYRDRYMYVYTHMYKYTN